MAVFAIPIPSITQEEIANDAIAGVSCALNMGTQVRSLNQQLQQQGLLSLAMRVSNQRLNHTHKECSLNKFFVPSFFRPRLGELCILKN